MIRNIVFLFVVISICNAKPYLDIGPQNVVTVPPNCPAGQEWVNGECRDIWRNHILPSNLVTVPPNCPFGQEYVNGQCRDVWIKTNSDQSRNAQSVLDFELKNVVTVPNNCKPSQQWVNGVCRDIWRSGVMPVNVITVPPNCPAGQEYVNGQCRDVWIKSERNPVEIIKKYVNDLNTFLSSSAQDQNKHDVLRADDFENKNVISVPNQCPAGYKPDALGICREIFNNN